jgi:surface polysaccharide O-acyltransferase-like enzyme
VVDVAQPCEIESTPPKAAAVSTLPSVVRNVPVIRGAAIAAVILDHSVEFTLAVSGVLAAPPPDWPRSEMLAALAVRSLAPQCVAAFFFAAGFFAFRFTSGWPAARTGARSIALRYALWAIPGYAYVAWVQRGVDWKGMAVSFLTAGPYYGTYWFLVVLFQLTLLAPLLARLVRRSTAWAIALCVVAQAITTALSYWEVAHGDVANSRVVLARIPFFLAGMLVSAHADTVVRAVLPHRTWIGWFALAAQGLMVAEAVLVGRWLGDGAPRTWDLGMDRLSMVIGDVAVIAWAITLPAREGRVRALLTRLGVGSLAIFLAGDLFYTVGHRLLWHLGVWAGLPKPPPGAVPVFLHSVWLAPIFVALCLIGPLAAAAAVERLLGKPARRFIFG